MKIDLILMISGMSCTGCASTIEKALNNKPGVLRANVNFAAEKGYITYDDQKVSGKELLETISALGYQAKTAEAQSDNAKLSIRGMTCTSCAAGLEKSIREIPGVLQASVNFSTEKMNIKYNPGIVSLDTLLKTVTASGFQATIDRDEHHTPDDNSHYRSMKSKMLYSAILSGLIMLIMIGRMTGIYIPQLLYHTITVILAFPVVFIFGWRVHKSSFKSVLNKSANMDVLVSLGSMPPYLMGLMGFFFEMQTFVEMSATIMTFHLIGKYLETRAKGKASNAIKKLINLGAKTARIERNGQVQDLPVEQVMVGDIMVIKAGEKIPADGKIIEGTTSIDESMISGEPMPVTKKTGDEIVGATLNQLGFIKAEVTKTGKDTFLAQVIKLVEECQGSKVPIQEFADRVTGIFVPVILMLTALTFISHLLFPAFHNAIIRWGAGFLPWINPELPAIYLAFITATAVLVISCPCALGLGTPTALMVGSGIGAEKGVLIKNGEAVQTLKDVEAIAFDKTGTLTKGKPVVTDIEWAVEYAGKDIIYYAATLESISEHPLALAVMEKSNELMVKPGQVESSEVIPGKGVRGLVDGKEVLVGNRKLFAENSIALDFEAEVKNLEEEAKTVILVAIDNKNAGIIAVADIIKDDTKEAIAQLKQLGIATYMITGDNAKTANAIAKSIGIDNVAAEVLPAGKVAVIKSLQQKYKFVAMVGDGINDAPSLKQANIGIAIGSGTDIAIEAADITLVSGSLKSVVTSIKLSKAIFRKIKENFFWAWIYNIVAIPVAMLGLLHPMIGAAAMSLSSLNVVYNSLRLKKVRL